MRWLRSLCVAMVLAAAAPTPARAASTAPVDLDPVGVPCGPGGWREVGEDVFRLPQGLLRSQGVATDGTSWYFSWQYGLERTDDRYVERLANPMAIPPDLAQQGIEHIGDIDLYDGKLVAPLSDASPYHQALLAYYDPETLQYLSSVPVDPTLHSGGISWVAVDPDGIAYTSQWIDAPVLNRYDANRGFAPLEPLMLEVPVNRMQGAKFIEWDGEPSLIGSTDENPKRVVRIDLEDGTVTELIRVCAAGEMEGIAIRQTPDGSLLHALFITGNQIDPRKPGFAPQDLAVHLFHYAPPEDHELGDHEPEDED